MVNNMNALLVIVLAGLVLMAGAALVVIACVAINGDFCRQASGKSVHPKLRVWKERTKDMKTSLSKALIWTALVVGVGLIVTSCATTGGNWSSDFPEKGSAKGGASQLMRR